MFRTSSYGHSGFIGETGRLAACAIAAAVALGASQLRAAPTPAAELSAGEAEELCEILDNQYQFTMKFKADLPYADEAKALHASGVEKCGSDKPAQGVIDLRKSLETLHVVPSEI